MPKSKACILPATSLLLLLLAGPALAQTPDGAIAYGPYNAVFLDEGTGLSKPLAAGDVMLDPARSGRCMAGYGWPSRWQATP